MDGQPSGDVRLDGVPSAAAAEALELLALPARQVRLLTAIHEAGHAVVGHTLLWADRQGCTEAAERHRRWRDEETAARWYRQPALTTPAALQSSSRSSS